MLGKGLKIATLALVALTGLILSAPVTACTGIKLISKDGSIVSGRTLEFGVKVLADVVVVPRGYDFVGTTPNGKGLTYKSKYAAVGAVAFNDPAIMDGMNEKGLTIGTFYFPGYAGYTPINSENQQKALSPVEFPNWILTQFATIDEVKAGLSSVVIAPTVTKSWGSAPAPFHYLVIDRQGNGLVIEPVNGKLVTYSNKLGVFTNSPTFDWHVTNLRNFINLTPVNSKSLSVDGVELAPFGQGAGMVGLPGDFTPPSRFVRAAIFSATAVQPANAQDGVFQTFHILNQFDIPYGVVRSVDNGTTYYDTTQMTVVREPQSLQYYFKTYDDQNIKVVDLKAFDLDAKAIKRTNSNGRQTATNISSEFKL